MFSTWASVKVRIKIQPSVSKLSCSKVQYIVRRQQATFRWPYCRDSGRECSPLSNGIRQKDVCSTVYLVQNNDLFTNWLLFSDKILTKG